MGNKILDGFAYLCMGVILGVSLIYAYDRVKLINDEKQDSEQYLEKSSK